MDEEIEAPVDSLEAMVEDEDDLGDAAASGCGCPRASVVRALSAQACNTD